MTVYVPFFVVAFACYDWRPRVQKLVIGSLAAINAVALVVFAGCLHWI